MIGHDDTIVSSQPPKVGVFNFYHNHDPFYGYVTIDNNKIDIETFKDSLHTLDGDKVKIENNKITEIVERKNVRLLGFLRLNSTTTRGSNKKGIPYKDFICLDRNYPNFIVPINKSLSSNNVYAYVRFISWDNTMYPVGICEELIGNIGDEEVEKQIVKYKNNIKHKKYKFDDKFTNDLTPLRTQIHDKCIFSIDPDGCTDIDDALEYDSNNNIVSVHIADPSSYVSFGSELDQQIAQRVETSYLTFEQINMIPDSLLEKCSLFQNVKKRAFTVKIYFDNNNKIIKTEFIKTKITVTYNMSYDFAQQVINSKVPKYNQLIDLYNFGQKLNKSEIYDVHKMVEIFMLLANTEVAKYLSEKIPDKVILRKYVLAKSNIYENMNLPAFLLKYMNIKKSPPAVYACGIENNAHESLDEKYYTHFTSPIRRYLDMMIHRMLYLCINNNNVTYDTQSICDIINIQQRHIKKAQKESELFQIIYNIYHNENSVVKKSGYIIEIKDNKIEIYIPEYKISIKTRLFSDELKKITKYVSSEWEITYDNMCLKLFQQIEFNIVIKIKEPFLKNKIMISHIRISHIR